mgnify:CR=1 FL=1
MTRIELLEVLTDETKKWWSIACRLYAPLPGNLPIISLDLRGVCAGKASILTILRLLKITLRIFLRGQYHTRLPIPWIDDFTVPLHTATLGK